MNNYIIVLLKYLLLLFLYIMICSSTIKGGADVHTSTPWVEKYRPTHFDEIVLDDINKKILLSIIEVRQEDSLLVR